jgi:hypothetical protein
MQFHRGMGQNHTHRASCMFLVHDDGRSGTSWNIYLCNIVVPQDATGGGRVYCINVALGTCLHRRATSGYTTNDIVKHIYLSWNHSASLPISDPIRDVKLFLKAHSIIGSRCQDPLSMLVPKPEQTVVNVRRRKGLAGGVPDQKKYLNKL